MENQELQQQNIVISEVLQTNWGFKIKDAGGLTYNLSATKKDGTPTKAYQALIALPNNGMGMTKCFKFAVVANNQGGQSRYVRIIMEPQATPSIPTTRQPINAPVSAPVASPAPTNPPVGTNNTPNQQNNASAPNWDKIAEGKVRFGFAIEAYKAHTPLIQDKVNQIEEWVKYVMTGKLPPVGKTVYVNDPNQKNEVAPTEDILPNDDEMISVEEIPF